MCVSHVKVSFTFVSIKYIEFSLYSYGTDTKLTLLEDVDCSSSSYLVLLQCSYSTVITSDCNDHDLDVFVVCCK